ncbi:MAG: tetratricopeptide repeat protein [Terracidiphilus sp.]|jgi:tetratricopeptide (TPR) repeat protein
MIPLPVVALALVLAVPDSFPAQAAQTTATAADLLRSGKPGEARDAYESLLDADPANQEAQDGEVAASEQLALAARSAGKMDDALKDLLQAQKYAPKNPRLLYDLGIQEVDMQSFKDADRTLALAEQLNPGEPLVLYAVGRVKLELGQLAPAEENMRAYLKLRPSDASAHYGLGRVLQLGMQLDLAQAEFHRSIELQPLQTEAYYQLGDIALKQGDFAEAIAEFNKTLARDPKHGGALTGTGQAYFKQKQYAQAAEFLERAVAAAPDYETGHYYLGLTLARLGRKEESERELALATRLADEAGKKARAGLRSTTPPENQ